MQMTAIPFFELETQPISRHQFNQTKSWKIIIWSSYDSVCNNVVCCWATLVFGVVKRDTASQCPDWTCLVGKTSAAQTTYICVTHMAILQLIVGPRHAFKRLSCTSCKSVDVRYRCHCFKIYYLLKDRREVAVLERPKDAWISSSSPLSTILSHVNMIVWVYQVPNAANSSERHRWSPFQDECGSDNLGKGRQRQACQASLPCRRYVTSLWSVKPNCSHHKKRFCQCSDLLRKCFATKVERQIANFHIHIHTRTHPRPYIHSCTHAYSNYTWHTHAWIAYVNKMPCHTTPCLWDTTYTTYTTFLMYVTRIT